MFNYYTKRSVNVIALIISIIIFFLINNVDFDISNIRSNKMRFNVSFNSGQIQENLVSETNEQGANFAEDTNEEGGKIVEDTDEIKTQSQDEEGAAKDANWQIIIPDISLSAEIAEGTTKDVLSKYVGHFENTETQNGNIGLAAHNRGYEVNYFENLKKLDYGAQIIYKCGDFTKTYIVETIAIIKNTDWSYLEETEDNRITLITCVENEPEYRRCIQGIEESEEREDF